MIPLFFVLTFSHPHHHHTTLQAARRSQLWAQRQNARPEVRRKIEREYRRLTGKKHGGRE